METLNAFIGIIIGLIGGYFLGLKKDVKAKKRELTTQYLINAYQTLVNEISQRPASKERITKLENLLSDIQLFGSDEQVKLAKKLADELVNSNKFELDLLVNSLRSELRKELGLSEIEGNVKWVRYNSSENGI